MDEDFRREPIGTRGKDPEAPRVERTAGVQEHQRDRHYTGGYHSAGSGGPL